MDAKQRAFRRESTIKLVGFLCIAVGVLLAVVFCFETSDLFHELLPDDTATGIDGALGRPMGFAINVLIVIGNLFASVVVLILVGFAALFVLSGIAILQGRDYGRYLLLGAGSYYLVSVLALLTVFVDEAEGLLEGISENGIYLLGSILLGMFLVLANLYLFVPSLRKGAP